MAKKLYDEDGNVVKGAKVKKPFYKRWWFILLVVLFIGGALASGDEDTTSEEVTAEEPDTEVVADADEETTEEVAAEEPKEEVEEEPEPEEAEVDVPREHRNALKKAESYLSWAGMSEKGLREQLEFEDFPQDAIDYAIENVEVDYNEQALEK